MRHHQGWLHPATRRTSNSMLLRGGTGLRWASWTPAQTAHHLIQCDLEVWLSEAAQELLWNGLLAAGSARVGCAWEWW